jgi:hypothetical protein
MYRNELFYEKDLPDGSRDKSYMRFLLDHVTSYREGLESKLLPTRISNKFDDFMSRRHPSALRGKLF